MGEENFKGQLLWKYMYTTDSLSNNHVHSKVDLYQSYSKNCEISSFGLLPIFFVLFSLTWDHITVKVSNDIFSESTHLICFSKFMHIPHAPGEGLH